MNRTTALTALLAVLLTGMTIAAVRAATLPSCNVRVGEICLSRSGDGPAIRSVEIFSRLEAEKYVFSLRSASGPPHELIVVRDDSLGTETAPPGSTARIDTRLLNGAKSSSYFITGAVPGVVVKICVESFLAPRCKGSGTLNRLRPYRG